MNETLKTIVILIGFIAIIVDAVAIIYITKREATLDKSRFNLESLSNEIACLKKERNELYNKIDALNFKNFDKFINNFSENDRYVGFYYTCKIMRDLNEGYSKERNGDYSGALEDCNFSREYFIGRAIAQDCVNTGMNIEDLASVIKAENDSCQYLHNYNYSKFRKR